jgi:hypothetical protein
MNEVESAIMAVAEAKYGQVTETIIRTWKIADGKVVFEDEESSVKRLIQKKH